MAWLLKLNKTKAKTKILAVVHVFSFNTLTKFI